MLAVREQTLPPFVPCELPSAGAVSAQPRADGVGKPEVRIREFYVPRQPVRVPEARRLVEAAALAEARASVARALDDLRDAEAALERQIAELRAFIEQRRTAQLPSDVA